MASRPKPGSNRRGPLCRRLPGHSGIRPLRTPGPIRTAVLRFRKPPLFPLSYGGMVRAERLELPEHEGNRVTAGPTSPSVARPLWGDRRDSNPASSGATIRRSTSELLSQCLGRVSNPRPPRCGRGALPLSYPGVVRRVGIEPDRGLLIRPVPPPRWTTARWRRRWESNPRRALTRTAVPTAGP
jgi:hypothetical protein